MAADLQITYEASDAQRLYLGIFLWGRPPHDLRYFFIGFAQNVLLVQGP